MRYKIGSYNGWNGEERLAVLPIIRAALEAEGITVSNVGL